MEVGVQRSRRLQSVNYHRGGWLYYAIFFLRFVIFIIPRGVNTWEGAIMCLNHSGKDGWVHTYVDVYVYVYVYVHASVYGTRGQFGFPT